MCLARWGNAREDWRTERTAAMVFVGFSSKTYSSLALGRCPAQEEWTDDRRHAAPHGVVGSHTKSAGTHQLHGRAVAAAATRKPVPRLEKEILACREEPRARADVFDKQKLAV